VKLRIWATEDECRAAAERLMRTPGLVVLSVSEPYPDHGASVLVRVFLECRLDPPPEPAHVTCTTEPARARRRRALPPGGQQ